MTTLIEIVCSLSKEEAARAAVEAFCQETACLVIGRRVYVETQEVLFMVQLLHAERVSNHPTVLGQALQQELIASFRFITCDLVKISFASSANMRTQMCDFPLRPGESWFPAVSDHHKAYVCMSRPVMTAREAAWLLGHDVEWSFV